LEADGSAQVQRPFFAKACFSKVQPCIGHCWTVGVLFCGPFVLHWELEGCPDPGRVSWWFSGSSKGGDTAVVCCELFYCCRSTFNRTSRPGWQGWWGVCACVACIWKGCAQSFSWSPVPYACRCTPSTTFLVATGAVCMQVYPEHNVSRGHRCRMHAGVPRAQVPHC
jgi:hypothetical protein